MQQLLEALRLQPELKQSRPSSLMFDETRSASSHSLPCDRVGVEECRQCLRAIQVADHVADRGLRIVENSVTGLGSFFRRLGATAVSPTWGSNETFRIAG